MQNLLRLSPRLQTAALAVRPGSVVADVGTDHGYLACALVQMQRCDRVYASDIHPGPLEQAAKTIRQCGLEEKVIPVLSDGVKELPLDEISDIVIAGMGGDLILSILQDARLFRPEKRFVLQPMTKHDVLRRGLYQAGFALLSETAVVDGRFVYSVLTAAYAGRAQQVGDLFAYTGLLLGQTEESTLRYLRRVVNRLCKQRDGLLRTKRPDLAEIAKLEILITQIERGIPDGKCCGITALDG